MIKFECKLVIRDFEVKRSLPSSEKISKSYYDNGYANLSEAVKKDLATSEAILVSNAEATCEGYNDDLYDEVVETISEKLTKIAIEYPDEFKRIIAGSIRDLEYINEPYLEEDY